MRKAVNENKHESETGWVLKNKQVIGPKQN